MSVEQREAMTVRIPSRLLESARAVRDGDESLNALLVAALEREVRRREGLRTVDRIEKHSQQIRARFGVHTDSVPVLKELREGIGRHD